MSVLDSLLTSDFQQCFAQMRHYDETFRHTLQFGFSGVAVVIAASAALIGQYGFTPLIGATVGLLLAVSSGNGFLLIVSLARNRVYFAFVARYVNELRGLYISQSPGGVSNKTGMYVDYKSPPIFNPGSSHSIQVYFLSACNAVLFAGMVAVLTTLHSMETGAGSMPNFGATVASFLLFMLLQCGGLLIYWWHKEQQKTADAAAFGKKK